MKRVVFLGRKEVASRCFRHLLKLHEQGEVEIVAALSSHHVLDRKESVADQCTAAGIPLLSSLDEYLALEHVDILVSVQFEQLLGREHLAKAGELNLNLHMAPLPEYRGCNQFSLALIHGKTAFGTTLHIMDEKIDNGAVLFERRFPVPENCWVEDLYALTVEASVSMFADSIGKIVAGEYEAIPQEKLVPERGTSLNYRSSIADLKRVEPNWDAERIDRHVRGTSMPGFEPPYMDIGGNRVYLVGKRYSLSSENRLVAPAGKVDSPGEECR